MTRQRLEGWTRRERSWFASEMAAKRPLVSADEPIDGPDYLALREVIEEAADRDPVLIDFEQAARLVATEEDKGDLAGVIAFTIANEREVATELAIHAVRTEIGLLGVLAEKMPHAELAERLAERIRAVVYPPRRTQ